MNSNRRRYEREDCKTPIIYSEYDNTGYYEATMYDKSAGGVNFESDTKIQSGLPVCIIMPDRTDAADASGTYETYIARVKWYQQGVLGRCYKIGAKLLLQGCMRNTGGINKDCGSCMLCDNKLFGEVYMADEYLKLCLSCFKYLGRVLEDCAEESVIRTKVERQLRESNEALFTFNRLNERR
ncbi:PilZ domain-containing protein [Desulfococcaceae bacterium HSG7]|nr:PilZ domain-containing protein [Desulfococcaceae bacterium HSG7]